MLRTMLAGHHWWVVNFLPFVFLSDFISSLLFSYFGSLYTHLGDKELFRIENGGSVREFITNSCSQIQLSSAGLEFATEMSDILQMQKMWLWYLESDRLQTSVFHECLMSLMVFLTFLEVDGVVEWKNIALLKNRE